MGRALNMGRWVRYCQGIVAAGFLMIGTSAYAYRNVACLLMGRIEQVEQQPLSEVLLRVQLQGVSDNNVHANEVECNKVFRVGLRLWVSLHTSAFTAEHIPRVGDTAWLSLRYMNAGPVLRKYEWITREAYLEKRDGIQ